MKQFRAFVKKEFRHILRDNRTLLIILGMPVVEILLFGFAINMEVQDIRVAFYDPTPDAFTTGIAERIRQNPYFNDQEAHLWTDGGINEKEILTWPWYFNRTSKRALSLGRSGRATAFEQLRSQQGIHSRYLRYGHHRELPTGTNRCHGSPIPNSNGKQDDLQPVDEIFLYVRSGYHGVGFNDHMYNYDISIHCTRKGERHHGGAARFSIKAGYHDFRENHSLHDHLFYRLFNHSSPELFHLGRAG